MSTFFLPGFTPRVIYRVIMLKGGHWQPFSNYHAYKDAELTASGLVTGGKCAACEIVRIDADGSKIIARISAEPAPGWPHGRAKVEKL